METVKEFETVAQLIEFLKTLEPQKEVTNVYGENLRVNVTDQYQVVFN